MITKKFLVLPYCIVIFKKKGKKIPPPPRKVIIERLPPLPSKPQSIIIERWLPYKPLKRKVIYQRANENESSLVNKPKNLIVQWETPNVVVKKEFKDLGIVRANPTEYIERYGNTLKRSVELPNFVKEIKPPSGLVLAADSSSSFNYELEGDLHALNLIDLENEGLNEYKSLLKQLNLDPDKYVIVSKQSLQEHNIKINNKKNINVGSIVSSDSANKINGNQNFINDLFSLVDFSSNSSISLDEAQKVLHFLFI
jgi:hypothetical protein